MKIVIIGAGFTGGLLAKELVAGGDKVVLIDNDPEKVRTAGDQLDCTVLEADGSRLDVLEEAGIASADALVTVTGDDDTNMIVCSLVDAICPHMLKIARVRNYERYRRVLEVTRRRQESAQEGVRPTFGIDYIVNPDVSAASSIIRAMEIGAAGLAIDIDEDYSIVVLPLTDGCALSRRKLRELSLLEGWNGLVAFVERDGGAFLPNGETELESGDHVGILVHKNEISPHLGFTGASAAQMERVAIFGADNVGALTLAAQTQSSGSFWFKLLSLGRSKKRRLIVIDRELSRCRVLSEKFPDARILNGDITDDALLQGEGICDCDLMIAASGNYERNLMTAAYLKLRGVGKAIALTSDSAFDGIAEKLGVDVTVPMRDVVIDTIVSRLRGRNVKSVHSVASRNYEIVSCEVSPDCKVVGKSLEEIGGLEKSLVLLVREPGKTASQIPGGKTLVREGSRVFLIVPAGERDVLEMFAGKRDTSV